jgi:glycerophosphoryl diester phosphodiesterase
MVTVLAHRGASTVARENTLEAFRQARRLGADGVELDARRSGDGAIVVCHDASIPGLGSIAALAAAQLPPHIPSIGAAIEACGDVVVVNVELKDLPGEPGFHSTYPLARMVARFVAEHDLRSLVVVSSFDLMALDAVHQCDPSIRTGWLTSSRYDQHDALLTVVERGHHALHPHVEGVTAALVVAAHDAGITVTTWTADEADLIRRLAADGVDGIITNRPDVARAALSRI